MTAALPFVVPGQRITVDHTNYMVAQQDAAPVLAALPSPNRDAGMPDLVRLDERLGGARLGDVVVVKELGRVWPDDHFGDWSNDVKRWNSPWRATQVERTASAEEWTEMAMVVGFSRTGGTGAVCGLDVELTNGRNVRFRKEDVEGIGGLGRFELGMLVEVKVAELPVECWTPWHGVTYVVPTADAARRAGDVRVRTVVRAVVAPWTEEELDEEADCVISRASTGLGWYSGLR